MKNIFRGRNVFFVFVVAFVARYVEFAYRKNNSCLPEDHRIQSEADAITVVKKKIVKDRSFSSQQFGSADEFVDSLREVENLLQREEKPQHLRCDCVECLSGSKRIRQTQPQDCLCSDVSLRGNLS